MLIVAVVVASCGVDIPKETPSSFETMIVKKADIEIPIKFSAKMKGQADVTIMPQVSGQLMKIYVAEGQQVRKGQTLFPSTRAMPSSTQRQICSTVPKHSLPYTSPWVAPHDNLIIITI